MQLNQSRSRRTSRKVDRDSLIRKLKHHLDAKQPIREEALLIGGLLDALWARYCANERGLKKYERRYLQCATGLLEILYEEIRTSARTRLPNRLWDGDQGLLNARLVVRYVIQKARWKLDDSIPERATAIWLIRANLGTMLRRFGMSPLQVMQTAYPEHFFDPKHPTKRHLWHPWDFSYQRMWQGRAGDRLAKIAIRHLVEADENWKLDKTLPQKGSEDWFCKVGLSGMLQNRFRDSPLLAFQAAYPEHFFDPKHPTKPHLWHPWDFRHKAMWQGRAGNELAKQAIRHMVEMHEGWKLDETVPQKITADWFQKVRLAGMLVSKKGLNSSPAAVLRFAFPEHFFEHRRPTKQHLWHDWDFKNRRRIWTGKAGEAMAKRAIRHLIEVHEGWPVDSALRRKATETWFKRVGLSGMLFGKFRGSAREALRFVYRRHFFDPAYPTKGHLWHPWEFRHQKKWPGRAGDELAKSAIRHLIEAHEGWKLDQTLPSRATEAWFTKVGLAGMLTHKFRGPRPALRFAYPELFGSKGRWPLALMPRKK
jgi:hypothetical protein